MKVFVTKKEFETAKALGLNITKELAKAESVTGINEDDVIECEEFFNNSLKLKGKWGKIIVRDDDNVESAKVRLTNYYALTYPIIDYYKEQGKLVSVDALQDIESVSNDIKNILGGK